MAKIKPELKLEKPIWLKYTEEEVKAIILKVANKGMTAEKIGLVLRDQYGIPKVKIYGLRIKKILEEKNKYEEPAIKNLNEKAVKIEKHYNKHKKDKKADRSMIITKAKLKKIQGYHQRNVA